MECLDSPLSAVKSGWLLRRKSWKPQRKAWQNWNYSGIAQNLSPGIEISGKKQLLKQKKVSVRVATRVFTGKCCVRIDLLKSKITVHSFCRECIVEEATIEHLGLQSQTLEGRILSALGIVNLGELAN